MQRKGAAGIADGNVKRCSCCGKQYGGSTKQNKQTKKIELLEDPASSFLGIQPKEFKTGL